MLMIPAGGCVFTAMWLVSLPPPAALRLAVALDPSAPGSTGPPAKDPPASAALRLVAALAPSASARASLPAYSAAAAALLRRALDRGRREAMARRAAVIELCDGISVELAAGRPPGAALIHAGDALTVLPGLTSMTDAARSGEDVAAALIRVSRTPGCEGLRLLAGCWRIGVERGGMLADVIEGLAEALRDEQSHREDVTLQLAGPRATARLLAALPALGLAMAAALGAHPITFLLGTLPGALCLALGISLDALGLWWTSKLATAAENAQ